MTKPGAPHGPNKTLVASATFPFTTLLVFDPLILRSQVPEPQEAVLDAARLDLRAGMERAVCDDGHSVVAGVEEWRRDSASGAVWHPAGAELCLVRKKSAQSAQDGCIYCTARLQLAVLRTCHGHGW